MELRIRVAESEVHGRGVFASERIAAGEVIERCPVLRIPASQRTQIDETLLYEYYFDWDGDAGLALGFGSLYNHSGDPNARYEKVIDEDVVVIRAVAEIPAGAEITFSYSGGS